MQVYAIHQTVRNVHLKGPKISNRSVHSRIRDLLTSIIFETTMAVRSVAAIAVIEIAVIHQKASYEKGGIWDISV